MKKNAYTYIMANQNNTSLYIGVKSYFEQRVFQHKSFEFPGFTSKYRVTKLVYFEDYKDIRNPIAREKFIKSKTRVWKEALIGTMNPQWNDLADFS